MSLLDAFKPGAYWLRIRRNHYELHDLNHPSSPVTTEAAFSTGRLLIGEFSLASHSLRDLIRTLHVHLMSNFVLVIEPCAMIEGGLSEVEEKLFHELGNSSGAHITLLHQGDTPLDFETARALALTGSH